MIVYIFLWRLGFSLHFPLEAFLRGARLRIYLVSKSFIKIVLPSSIHVIGSAIRAFPSIICVIESKTSTVSISMLISQNSMSGTSHVLAVSLSNLLHWHRIILNEFVTAAVISIGVDDWLFRFFGFLHGVVHSAPIILPKNSIARRGVLESSVHII